MSRENFLSKEIISAFLKKVGKLPSKKERLAKTEISSKNARTRFNKKRWDKIRRRRLVTEKQ